MFIAIPFEERGRTLIRSSFVVAKLLSETTYNLFGNIFQMTQVTAEQALPLESFVSVSSNEALPNVLCLLLLTAVADGRISDEEPLSILPALEGCNWHANVAVQVGNVFTYKGSL